MNFQCSLGGIAIRCSSEYCLVQNDSDVTWAKDFISFARLEKKPEQQPEDLQVHIASCCERKPAVNQLEKILTQQRSSFYKTEKGYLQVLHLTPSEEVFLWALEIDPQFERFDYALFLDNIAKTQKPLLPSKLALSLFLLQHSFINQQGLISHAAGGSVYGKGLVFPAPSGGGKSTLSRLLFSNSQNCLFSEERLIIRSVNDTWQVWGTPWHGEGRIARNESAPLSALIFLRQAQQTRIVELPPSIGLHRLLQTVSIPWYSEEWTSKGLVLCERLLKDIPVFELAFRPDQSAREAIEKLALSLQ
ncbi:MAG: hypothetical protein WGN25_16190 [Candidatus Electrothrix sp. GW3-4]|uniref:hypothetical protein n=1 Tax=Candidatus Electrothrix sp. GW3-4 TaxID=3126740 RepID=UPI0030D132F2